MHLRKGISGSLRNLVMKIVARAQEIDRETGTTFWLDAIKEIQMIWPVFKFLKDGETVPVGFTHIDLNVIFDIKMDFTNKCHICA